MMKTTKLYLYTNLGYKETHFLILFHPIFSSIHEEDGKYHITSFIINFNNEWFCPDYEKSTIR